MVDKEYILNYIKIIGFEYGNSPERYVYNNYVLYSLLNGVEVYKIEKIKTNSYIGNFTNSEFIEYSKKEFRRFKLKHILNKY